MQLIQILFARGADLKRVYDFSKERKRLLKPHRKSREWNDSLIRFEDGTEHGTDEWSRYLLEHTDLHRSIEGTISEVKRAVNDGRGFPTFKLTAETDTYEWQRYGQPGLFRNYPDDKYYQVGKRAVATIVDQYIASSSSKYYEAGESISTVVYVDVDE